jgi:hypothetical protein
MGIPRHINYTPGNRYEISITAIPIGVRGRTNGIGSEIATSFDLYQSNNLIDM